jgi:hypothetical protein
MADENSASDQSEAGSGSPTPESKNPIDQLMELLVYAPVGLIYEYEDVLPQLVKRGRSQVQLAKVLGQMASQQGQQKAKQGQARVAKEGSSVDEMVSDAIGQAALILAKAVTEFGQVVGLAPVSTEPTADSEAAPPPRAPKPLTSPQKRAGTAQRAPKAPTVPIAGYDSLKAREIVPMLDDLTAAQRKRVRAYELATRGRKTILGKLDKLER